MTHSYVGHVASRRVSWLIHMRAKTHVHDRFIRVTWRIHMCDMTHLMHWDVRHDSFICVTWLIHMCDMTHSYVWRDSFICVTWLIHMCDVTHSYVWHGSFTCVTWLIHMCDMTNSYVWHPFICVTWLIPSVWHDSFTCATCLVPLCLCISYLSASFFFGLPGALFFSQCLIFVLQFQYIRIFVKWRVRMCAMMHLDVWHNLSIRVMWLISLWLCISFRSPVKHRDSSLYDSYDTKSQGNQHKVTKKWVYI